MAALSPKRAKILCLALVWLALGAVTSAANAAKRGRPSLPAKFQRAPYSLMSLTVGHPNAGYQIRGIRLRKRRFLKIKAGSKSRNWGHPSLVKMLYRTSRDIARSAKGSVLLVGDLSSKKGGSLIGHASHQSGRDADIGFFAKDAKGRSVKLTRFIAFDAAGHAKDGSGLVFDDWRNWLLVQSWLRDGRASLSQVFISSPLRRRLLAFAQKQPRYRKYVHDASRLLNQPRDSSAHDDHFHVRIGCPKRQRAICREHPR